MLCYARLRGFCGTEDSWEEEYRAMCAEFRWDDAAGVDVEQFTQLLDSETHGVPRMDDFPYLLRILNSDTAWLAPRAPPGHCGGDRVAALRGACGRERDSCRSSSASRLPHMRMHTKGMSIDLSDVRRDNKRITKNGRPPSTALSDEEDGVEDGEDEWIEDEERRLVPSPRSEFSIGSEEWIDPTAEKDDSE